MMRIRCKQSIKYRDYECQGIIIMMVLVMYRKDESGRARTNLVLYRIKTKKVLILPSENRNKFNTKYVCYDLLTIFAQVALSEKRTAISNEKHAKFLSVNILIIMYLYERFHNKRVCCAIRL